LGTPPRRQTYSCHGSALQKANKARTLAYYLPPNPVEDAKNATGDGYHSDGRLLVIFLQ